MVVARLWVVAVLAFFCLITEANSVSKTSSWWDGAESCKSRGQRLYVAQGDESGFEDLQSNSFYWIGAISYPSLVWTYDSSEFYKYEGTFTALAEEGDHILAGNSAHNCHMNCGHSNRVGLSGRNCYCDVTGLLLLNDASPNRCPGNMDEFCGSGTTMSIYSAVTRVEMDTENRGECYFAVKRSDDSVELVGGSNCSTGRSMAGYTIVAGGDADCHYGVCTNLGDRSWDTWNSEGSLLKITPNSIRHLPVIMEEFDNRRHSYWVGLKKMDSRRSVNGAEVTVTQQSVCEGTECCLAVMRETDTTLVYYWLPCLYKYKVVCQEANETTPTTTHVPALTTTQRSSSSTQYTTLSTGSQSTNGESTLLISSTASNSSHDPVVAAQSGGSALGAGQYVGIVLGSLVVVAMVVAIVIKRRSISDRLQVWRESGTHREKTSSPDRNQHVDDGDVYATINDNWIQHARQIQSSAISNPDYGLPSADKYVYENNTSANEEQYENSDFHVGETQTDNTTTNEEYYNWDDREFSNREQLEESCDNVSSYENTEVHERQRNANPKLEQNQNRPYYYEIAKGNATNKNSTSPGTEGNYDISHDEIVPNEERGEIFDRAMCADDGGQDEDYDAVGHLEFTPRADDNYAHVTGADGQYYSTEMTEMSISLDMNNDVYSLAEPVTEL